MLIIVVQMLCFQTNASAQQTVDTTSVMLRKEKKFVAEPLKATMFAVVFPGLGQIYNRKYWKIPLVYAGFGGLAYSIGFNSSNYVKYMKAYQDFTDRIPATNSFMQLDAFIGEDPSTYDEFENPQRFFYYKDQMIRLIDYYKRYRDLSYIGIGAWYLISIIDANVDASLFNYDISDNLDVAIMPVQITTPGGYLGAGVNFSVRVTF